MLAITCRKRVLQYNGRLCGGEVVDARLHHVAPCRLWCEARHRDTAIRNTNSCTGQRHVRHERGSRYIGMLNYPVEKHCVNSHTHQHTPTHANTPTHPRCRLPQIDTAVPYDLPWDECNDCDEETFFPSCSHCTNVMRCSLTLTELTGPSSFVLRTEQSALIQKLQRSVNGDCAWFRLPASLSTLFLPLTVASGIS